MLVVKVNGILGNGHIGLYERRDTVSTEIAVSGFSTMVVVVPEVVYGVRLVHRNSFLIILSPNY